jgi:hypothetical protein
MLSHYQIGDSIGATQAPAFTLQILVGSGHVRHKLLPDQLRLKLCQTDNDRYKEVDLDAALTF